MEDTAWHAALDAAFAAWPADDLRARAAALRAQGAALGEHLGDLALALAAARGDARAVRRVDEELVSRVDPVVRRIDASAAFVDEIKQALRVYVLVGGPGTPARIGGYQGRGPLVAWVRVAAMRVALNAKRARRETPADEGLLAELVAREPDPELAALEVRHRGDFTAALRDALAALPERARMLLRLHHVEGMRLARIGGLYGVHESTVSRWLQKAADDVLAGTEERLRERLALSPASFTSLARALRGGLELSISRLLGTGGTP